MVTAIIGWALIGLCTLGVLIAAWGWWFITRQVRLDDQMRQETREALDAAMAALTEPITKTCAEHNTVFIDFCPDCRVADAVALTRLGFVVHSD